MPAEEDAASATYYLPMDAPLPMPVELDHRHVLGRHLWVGVQRGVVLVLDDDQDRMFRALKSGVPPNRVLTDFAPPGMSAADSLPYLEGLVEKMSVSGFLTGIEGHHDERIASPNRFARFHLTKACQLECIHCYADSSPYVDRSGEIGTDRWLRLVDEFADNRGERILFTGGEALIHKGCLDIMRRAKERRLHTTLFTNGILVKRMADRICEVADQVQVSLDGPDAPTNDAIRGQGTYRKIIEAIDILIGHGVSLRIGISVMNKNWEVWRNDFLEFAKRYEGKDVEFRLGFGITHYGRGGELEDDLDPDQTQPEVNAMLARVNKGKLKSDDSRITRKTTGCGYNEQLVVGPDGTIYPCHLLDAPVGHIDERPLKDMLQTLKEMARLFDVDHCEDCKDCSIRYLCGGTCRVINGKTNGSRLINTCTPDEKERRYRNLVRMYL